MNFVINKAGNDEQLWVKYYFNPAKTNVFFLFCFLSLELVFPGKGVSKF